MLHFISHHSSVNCSPYQPLFHITLKRMYALGLVISYHPLFSPLSLSLPANIFSSLLFLGPHLLLLLNFHSPSFSKVFYLNYLALPYPTFPYPSPLHPTFLYSFPPNSILFNSCQKRYLHLSHSLHSSIPLTPL